MLNLGTGELLLIALVALVVLGPNKLPDAARQVGRWMGELRRLSSGFQAELRDALKEPVDGTPSSATHTAGAQSTSSTPSTGGAMSAPRRSPQPAAQDTAEQTVEPASNGSNPPSTPPA